MTPQHRGLGGGNFRLVERGTTSPHWTIAFVNDVVGEKDEGREKRGTKKEPAGANVCAKGDQRLKHWEKHSFSREEGDRGGLGKGDI